jgi:hypothetical protein
LLIKCDKTDLILSAIQLEANLYVEFKRVIGRYNDIPKLNENQKQSLEGEISLPELTSALKRMKNNKSPGSDGFTADFFKFFWIQHFHLLPTS